MLLAIVIIVSGIAGFIGTITARHWPGGRSLSRGRSSTWLQSRYTEGGSSTSCARGWTRPWRPALPSHSHWPSWSAPARWWGSWSTSCGRTPHSPPPISGLLCGGPPCDDFLHIGVPSDHAARSHRYGGPGGVGPGRGPGFPIAARLADLVRLPRSRGERRDRQSHQGPRRPRPPDRCRPHRLQRPIVPQRPLRGRGRVLRNRGTRREPAMVSEVSRGRVRGRGGDSGGGGLLPCPPWCALGLRRRRRSRHRLDLARLVLDRVRRAITPVRRGRAGRRADRRPFAIGGSARSL